MSRISECHRKLNDDGEGSCSVPMWAGGLPAGFCNQTAYGMPVKKLERGDRYVPALACPNHGGPKEKR